MGNRSIFLAIFIAIGILAFLVGSKSIYGLSEKQSQWSAVTVPSSKRHIAIWTITSMRAKPNCYKRPAKEASDFIYELEVEFQATPHSLLPGDLVIEAKYVSNYETTVKAPMNVADATGTWSRGTTRDLVWGADIVKVTKVTPYHFALSIPFCHVSWKVDGRTPLKITGIAHTFTRTGKNHTDKRVLRVNPCKP
jgi:hypothetical protein